MYDKHTYYLNMKCSDMKCFSLVKLAVRFEAFRAAVGRGGCISITLLFLG